MYASAHFTKIELVALENLSIQQHEWNNIINYCKKLYGNRLAFKNREVGEKRFKISARLKETTLPSSIRSKSSMANSTSVRKTEREADFIAYTKVMENCMTVLQMDAGKADGLTVSPPSNIIANTGTSDNAATLMADIHKD